MSSNTTRFAIKKPDLTDQFLTSDFQTNYDKIDAAVPMGTLGYSLSKTANDISTTTATAPGVEIGHVAVTDKRPAGSTKRINIMFSAVTTATNGAAVVRLYRDTTALHTWSPRADSSANINVGEVDQAYITAWYSDDPPAGMHTYYYYLAAIAGGTATVLQTAGNIRSSIWVFEL